MRLPDDLMTPNERHIKILEDELHWESDSYNEHIGSLISELEEVKRGLIDMKEKFISVNKNRADVDMSYYIKFIESLLSKPTTLPNESKEGGEKE